MTDQISRIAVLNDRVRQGLDPRARIVITAACAAALADGDDRHETVRSYGDLLMAIDRCDFAPDERVERRRGEVTFQGRQIRFAIDYYDGSIEWGSENPADPDVTTRVMTIMLPEDD
ncbi:DUF3768 domain-containing protein [Sphingomonas sp. ABOLE]|jgi:hypothetical protein|uniref:DUF3768 domain-containing protein n=1 Tax=Sphingomonas sp. ABOLE TaxID=1985878 RepID=UPI000F7E17F9|nr:DUF3768 domain-containing protein [Sphingomonas sp. ABOLE]RSV41701.1 DUF3768 domain-containing protein [Sphingomonas sp. ABOLE]